MDQEKHSFILSWATIIWKRIWRCAYLYSQHQEIDITSDVILKCLKYNLLSPTGIVDQLLPSLKIALEQGFLMPKEYEKDKYVKKAVSLFGEAYKISKYTTNSYNTSFNSNDRKNMEFEFIKEQSSHMDTKEDEDILNVKCDKKNEHCNFCCLVKVWDIDLSLYDFKDNYKTILMYTLLSIFENRGMKQTSCE